MILYENKLHITEIFFVLFVDIPMIFLLYGLLVNNFPIPDAVVMFLWQNVFVFHVMFGLFMVMCFMVSLILTKALEGILKNSSFVDIETDSFYVFLMWLKKNHPMFVEEKYKGWDGSISHAYYRIPDYLYYDVFGERIDYDDVDKDICLFKLKRYIRKNSDMMLFKLL